MIILIYQVTQVIGQRPPIENRVIPRFVKRHPLVRVVVVSRVLVRIGLDINISKSCFDNRLAAKRSADLLNLDLGSVSVSLLDKFSLRIF